MNEMLRAAALDRWAPSSRQVIGIGEIAVSRDPDATIATHAVGSCIAVCVFDPVTVVAGMLHFLLPEASINPERAERHPAVVVNDEIFYDFRAGRYNRNRPQFGVSLPVRKHLSVTPYYMMDFEWHPAGWDRDNIWGLNFNADF